MAKHQTKSTATKNGVPRIPKVADRHTVRQKVKSEPFAIVMEIVKSLDAASIHYEVTMYRCDSISILAHLPGERWEIDVMEDGDVDFERFVSDGTILERAELDQHIAKWRKIEEE